MPHIFFQKLEKRRSTDSLWPFNPFDKFEGLEQQVGFNIQDHMRDDGIYSFDSYFGFSNQFPDSGMRLLYGAGIPSESPWSSDWGWHSSGGACIGMLYGVGIPSGQDWSSPWPINDGRWSWSPGGACIGMLYGVGLPSGPDWSSPWSSDWSWSPGGACIGMLYGVGLPSGSNWSLPWSSNWGWSPGASNLPWSSGSPWSGSDSAYPPGTLYGLIKRAHLIV